MGLLIICMEDEIFDEDMEEENVYKKDKRDDLLENDEISAVEEGFMSGYDDTDKKEEEDEDEE